MKNKNKKTSRKKNVYNDTIIKKKITQQPNK